MEQEEREDEEDEEFSPHQNILGRNIEIMPFSPYEKHSVRGWS
jgi:hypothetical protein